MKGQRVFHFFFMRKSEEPVLFPPSLTRRDSSAFQIFLPDLLLFLNSSVCFRGLCREKFLACDDSWLCSGLFFFFKIML